MKMLPEPIRTALPPIGASRETPLERVMVQARFKDASTEFSWYVIEFDGSDRFFGIVAGRHAVLGEFTLSELESIREPDDTPGVIFDESFQPSSVLSLAKRIQSVAQLLPPPSPDLVSLE